MKAWITKDEDGLIHLHSNKPEKGRNSWYSSGWYHIIYELPEGVNPQWEDEEPIEVEFKI